MIIAPKTRQIRILYTILIAGGALLVVLLLRSLFLHKEQLPPALEVGNATEKEWVLSLGSFSIPVTLADSPEEREQGLSGTLSLPKESGLLFLFDKPDFYGFWMKDMAYPLDIVWIDKDFKIIGISKDIAPNSYPQIFYPPSPAQFVLEVNAGFSTQHNLSENQLLTLTQETRF